MKIYDLNNNSNIFGEMRDLVQDACISFEFFAKAIM